MCEIEAVKRGTVLVVDADLASREVVERTLLASGWTVLCAATGDEALALATRGILPDVVVLDARIPEVAGQVACRALRGAAATGDVPIVFLTERTHTSEQADGLDVGVIDYVTRPLDQRELRARVAAAARLKHLQDELREQARTDPLTRLWSRAYLLERLEEELARANRRKRPLSCAVITVDQFKWVREHLGAQAADETLVTVGNALRSARRESDFMGRMDGAEFAVIFAEATETDAVRAAGRMRTATARIQPDPHEERAHLTVSVGVACKARSEVVCGNELLRAAGEAMRAAVLAGRNRVEVAAGPLAITKRRRCV